MFPVPVIVAITHADRIGWALWILLAAPDLFGLLPAALFGRSAGRGYLPPRAVWLYNAWHTYTVPIVAWLAALFVIAGDPWPVLGWVIHITADRFLGFGLRGADGGEAVI